MRYVDEANVLLRLARWGIAMARHDTGSPSPVPDNPKFMSPRDAVALIRDGAVVGASGIGAHHRASILYWALRERFEHTGRPRGLTLLNIGGHGSRGVLPGTLDELARPGLCRRFITSHFETFHALQDLAAGGQCELQCIPLGILALLFDALGRGKSSVASATGVGTFIDPRVGRGSPVAAASDDPPEQLVSVERGRLRYRIPAIDVALFNLPAADRHGNLYARGAAIVGDSHELARAAKRNGGTVIANVGMLVEEGYDRVFLPAGLVDAVVYHPDTEQTPGFFHRDPWPAVTVGGAAHIEDALDRARFARWLGELTGALTRRTAVDEAVVRLAAATLADHVPKGAAVALGAGMPEDVGRVLYESGRLHDVTLMVESGVVGGVPAPGAYFGASFAPREIISPAELFKRCYSRLDAACLGALEVDAAGNVNVSMRGEGVRGYAGPGGFIDFTSAADTLIFVCGWMRGGAIEIEHGTVRVRERGAPKFVERVREVTFNGRRAIRAGKTVFYATPVGLFRLTARGLELEARFLGIDVRQDVLGLSGAPIVVPDAVPLLPRSIVTGEGFTLPPLRAGADERVSAGA
jgi:propionate CoA-transferase